ncbi:hypothetical protein JY651_47860 [Pyxidicoccus parkwayensis]|uniref:Uncharacterized protein n=1 Tax=Pyxidicoccus parkwayensis TaxID=2813578 RepID=A0ABX7NZ59_9BACT|nr:hypothetical protein [Pyxidicoccus parkwaysis]QSQ22735.1 hypothetical protein JY651_47860 [Pyxidicoccus parkwaysis]
MLSKTVWMGLIPLVAGVALWTPAAQAAWTCEDDLQACLYSASQDPDSRAREIYTEWCYEAYPVCENSGVCNDGYCQYSESSATCPEDCD